MQTIYYVVIDKEHKETKKNKSKKAVIIGDVKIALGYSICALTWVSTGFFAYQHYLFYKEDKPID